MASTDIIARYILKFHDAASRGLLGASRNARGLRNDLANLAAQAGIAASATAAIKQAMDFQTLLTDIEQKADGGAAAVAGLGDKLQKAAAAAGQLPIEAGKAYDALLGMGADSKTADAMIGPMLRAATAYRASSDDIAKAGFAAVDTLKVPATEITNVLNAMASAGKDGKIELRDMARSFPSLAAQMANLGARGPGAVASMAAALETVGKAAGSPDEAATNFANLLAKIDSKETRDRFAKFGVNLPEALKKRTKAGQDVIEAFIGEINALEKRGVNVKDVVSDQQASLGLSALRQNYAEYIAMRDRAAGKSGGMVDKDFERRMKDFQPRLNQLLGLLQTLAIQVGGPIIDALTPVLTFITDTATKFPNATRGIAQFGAGMFAAHKALGLFGGSWSGMIRKVVGSRGMGMLVNQGMKLGPMLMRGAAMLGPWGIAAAAAGTAAFALYENWNTVGPMMNTAVGKIGAQISKIDFAKMGGDLSAKISNWFNSADWGAVGAVALAGLGIAFKIALAAVKFFGGLAVGLLGSAFSAAWNGIVSITASAWESMKSSAISAINWIIDKLNKLGAMWNSFAPSSMRVGPIASIAPAVTQATNIAAGRPGAGGKPAPVTGSVDVVFTTPDGKQKKVPVAISQGGSNHPRQSGRWHMSGVS